MELFFPFIYNNKQKTEQIEQISLYIEEFPIIVEKEPETEDAERVAIIEIL